MKQLIWYFAQGECPSAPFKLLIEGPSRHVFAPTLDKGVGRGGKEGRPKAAKGGARRSSRLGSFAS